jgi:uncharacterized protein
MRLPHFSRTIAVLVAVAVSHGATGRPLQDPAPIPGASNFTIFVRGMPLGTEQTAVTRTGSGWTITTANRIGAPLEIVTRRAEFRYTGDWKPLDASIDMTVRGAVQRVKTTISGTTASSEITAGSQSTTKTDIVDATAVVLPNLIFGAFEAVAARLASAEAGATIPLYLLPNSSATLTVGESAPEQIQTSARLIAARRTHVTVPASPIPLEIDLKVDEAGRLLRISIPAQGLEVIRDDIGSVATRQVVISRSNDEQIRIPANGFTLAATVSKPATPPAPRLPAVVLTSGSGPMDRDEVVFGIPILGQVAGVLADAGFLVVRYDKRGIGQSGGRVETAALADFAEDQRAAVKYVSERKDVDPKRVGVAGHSEGGVVSLIAASKEKRIAAVVLIATNGVRGAEVVLAQQQRLLDKSNLSDADKQSRIALQKQINEAALSGKLDTLPAAIRRQVDNAEFLSILSTDPAAIMPNVPQPILIVQGELDTQVEPSNADKLEALARARKKGGPVEVLKVPGINHLLVPATTGDLDEYSRLTDKQVSPAVTGGIVKWLQNTLR